MKKIKSVAAVLVAASLLLSAVACDSTSNSKSKKDKEKGKKKDTSIEDVVSATEDYTKALQDMDTKKLSKMSTEIDDEFIDNLEAVKDSDMVDFAEAILDSVEFEIDEDSADVDDDEASIKVKYTYVDVSAIEGAKDLDDLIDLIDDCDETKSGKFTIEFEVDDDDYLVSNADEIIEGFYDNILVLSYTFEEVDYYELCPFDVYTSDISMEGTDALEFTLSYYDFSELDGEEISVIVSDENYNIVYDVTCYFDSNTDETISIYPSDVGLDEFGEGALYVDASLVHYDYMSSDKILVEGANTEVIVIGSNYADSLGYVENDVYINPYFDVMFTYPSELINLGPLDDLGVIEGKIDSCYATADAATIIYTLVAPYYDMDTLILSFSTDGNVETVDVDGMTFFHGIETGGLSEFFVTYDYTAGTAWGVFFMGDSEDDMRYAEDVIASVERYIETQG